MEGVRKFSLPDVRWRRRLGIEPKTRKLTEEDKRKLVALYKEGYTQQEIAEMMGITKPRVSQILEEVKNDQMIILNSDPPSSIPAQSIPVDEPFSPSSEKLIDATPYLKGGGKKQAESEDGEDLEDLEEEVIDQGHVVEYSEEDFEEPEEVITTPIAEARRGWELFKSAIEALMKV